MRHKFLTRIFSCPGELNSNITSKLQHNLFWNVNKKQLPTLRGLLYKCQFHRHCGLECSTPKVTTPPELKDPPFKWLYLGPICHKSLPQFYKCTDTVQMEQWITQSNRKTFIHSPRGNF
jgi:hypothetical protein